MHAVAAWVQAIRHSQGYRLGHWAPGYRLGCSSEPPSKSPTPLPLSSQASDLPAPSPIEQRWSARSRAPLSPAHSPGGDDLHCWVGIIMYLPEGEAEVEAVRARITKRFWEYNDLCRHKLWQVCWLRVGLGLELGRRQGWGWGREWGPS